jgi:hypothetical protein
MTDLLWHPELVRTNTLPRSSRWAPYLVEQPRASGRGYFGSQTVALPTAVWPVGVVGLILHVTC